MKSTLVVGNGWAYGSGKAKDWKPNGAMNRKLREQTEEETEWRPAADANETQQD